MKFKTSISLTYNIKSAQTCITIVRPYYVNNRRFWWNSQGTSLLNATELKLASIEASQYARTYWKDIMLLLNSVRWATYMTFLDKA